MKKGFFVLYLLIHAVAKGNITLPAVISSNMVLQQKSSVKFWGWGGPTEKVTITTSWNNKTDSTKVDENAKWQIALETPSAGGPYTITIKGNNVILLQNILIGEVWICSGQSNMEMNYNWGVPQMKADLPSAFNPNIRFFTVPKTTALSPQETGKGEWALCDSNTVKSFSAVGYYFGRALNADLNVPVGLINASWSGTPAETWTPVTLIDSNAVLKTAAQKLTRAAGWPITPGYTYNGMIAPITNFSIAGAIWYQGESNTGTAASYQPLLSTMITAWRRSWSIDFPFYFVQLAPFKYGSKNIAALLREAQTKTLALPKTGMVVSADLVDDTLDIHPKNKRDVGLRLAMLALSDAYDRTKPGAKSPLYKTTEIVKNKISLSFDNVSAGLLIKGAAATGFYIAGADKVFYPAQVKINGNKIEVWSKAIANPVAVRYAFSNTAAGNIFSKEGLPLSPFRTDDWQVDTPADK
jgi:sialate O-acetylesterase